MKIGQPLGSGAVNALHIQTYLEDLQEEYDALNVGIYCSDPAVDAVIAWQHEKLTRDGIEFQCQCQGYIRGNILESHLADLVCELLEIGQSVLNRSETSERGNHISDRPDESLSQEMFLSMKMLAGQLLITMECRSESGFLRKIDQPRWIAIHGNRYNCSTWQSSDKNRQEIVVALSIFMGGAEHGNGKAETAGISRIHQWVSQGSACSERLDLSISTRLG